MRPITNKSNKPSLAVQLIRILSSLLNSLPIKYQNKFFEIVLKIIPISLLKFIPCSYSAYIKQYKPQKGNVIIDCGAHIGNCTILFSRLVGKNGFVIALEPYEDSFRILKQRTKNLKCKILALNKGVWCENKKIPLNFFKDQSISCKIVYNDDVIPSQNIKMVDCITIDNLIKKIKPVRLDMIKMDIEGSEIEALKGAVQTMGEYSPKFSIASYHIINNIKTCFWIENFLTRKGYSVKTFFPPHLTTYGAFRR